MKNYVFTYHNDEMPAGAPVSDVAATWGAWFGSLGDKLVDAGNPFGDSKAVTKSGVGGVKAGAVTGYTIVKAASLDDAVVIAQGCPVLEVPVGGVDVYETLPM